MRARQATALAAVIGVLSIPGLLGQFRMPLNGDSAYVLDVARRMVSGSVLYRDIIDMNPPFIFWASMPFAALGLDGPTTLAVFKVATIVVVLAMLAAAWPHARNAPPLWAGILLMALVLPGGYFGQREHFLLALIFPYVAVAAARADGAMPGRVAAIAAGVLAAFGIALKPTAVIAPTLVVLQQCRWARSWRPIVAPEHVALAAGTLVAVAAVLLLAPGYPSVVAAIEGPYREFNRESLGALLGRDIHMWSVWLALAAAALFGRTLAPRRRVTLEVLLMLGLFASAVLQGKGFGYHYFPALAMAVVVLLELGLGTALPDRLGMPRRVASFMFLIPIVWLFGAVMWRRAGGVVNQARVDQATVDSLIGAEPTRVAILSARMLDAYPLVPVRGHRMVLSYPQLWAAAVPAGRPGTAAIRRRYGEDIAGGKPVAIVVRAPAAEQRASGDLDVNYLDYLCTDAVARRALSNYRLADRAGGFDLYRLDAIGPQACVSS